MAEDTNPTGGTQNPAGNNPTNPVPATTAEPKERIKVPKELKTIKKFMVINKSEWRTAKVQKIAVGFFVVWCFEKNVIDFAHHKIEIEGVKNLKDQKITITQFVDTYLKDEFTSDLLVPHGESFAKYYFEWKYLSDFNEILGTDDNIEDSWVNYAKIKAKIDVRYAHWAADPMRAKQEKIKAEAGAEDVRAGQLKTRGNHLFKMPEHPNTVFDEDYFLILLEGSISLTMPEKQRVMDAIPRLKIEQINELIAIFEEEREKFSELEQEFPDDVARLKSERENEWDRKEVKIEEAAEEGGAADEAAELKRKLMGE